MNLFDNIRYISSYDWYRHPVIIHVL